MSGFLWVQSCEFCTRLGARGGFLGTMQESGWRCYLHTRRQIRVTGPSVPTQCALSPPRFRGIARSFSSAKDAPLQDDNTRVGDSPTNVCLRACTFGSGYAGVGVWIPLGSISGFLHKIVSGAAWFRGEVAETGVRPPVPPGNELTRLLGWKIP